MVLWRATLTVTLFIRLYGHLRGPLTLTPITERLTSELSQPVFVTTDIQTPNLPHAGPNALPTAPPPRPGDEGNE